MQGKIGKHLSGSVAAIHRPRKSGIMKHLYARLDKDTTLDMAGDSNQGRMFEENSQRCSGNVRRRNDTLKAVSGYPLKDTVCTHLGPCRVLMRSCKKPQSIRSDFSSKQ